jgi:cell wall-associated NlpC family hydrolase
MRKLTARVAAGAVGVAMTTGLLVGTAGPAAAAACRTSFSSYSAVKAGSTGSPAAAVQCLLNRSGYPTKIDRSFSAADGKRLKTFQSSHHLPATGSASGRTWAALISAGSRPTLRQGSRGADVRRLQLALRALGHRELPGTTYYGPATTAAVKAQQRSLGWKQKGVATNGLWLSLQAGGLRPAASPSTKPSSSSSKGAKALAFAKKQLGEKYKYGAAGPNAWDCSGLTMKAWQAAGVNLPHSAAGQAKKGRKVARADLLPGDLVFFYSPISHVGIYAGGGKVIHASRPGKPVAAIKISYMPYQGARRPG